MESVKFNYLLLVFFFYVDVFGLKNVNYVDNIGLVSLVNEE